LTAGSDLERAQKPGLTNLFALRTVARLPELFANAPIVGDELDPVTFGIGEK
jgi:hypothetical protein